MTYHFAISTTNETIISTTNETNMTNLLFPHCIKDAVEFNELLRAAKFESFDGCLQRFVECL